MVAGQGLSPEDQYTHVRFDTKIEEEERALKGFYFQDF